MQSPFTDADLIHFLRLGYCEHRAGCREFQPGYLSIWRFRHIPNQWSVIAVRFPLLLDLWSATAVRSISVIVLDSRLALAECRDAYEFTGYSNCCTCVLPAAHGRNEQSRCICLHDFQLSHWFVLSCTCTVLSHLCECTLCFCTSVLSTFLISTLYFFLTVWAFTSRLSGLCRSKILMSRPCSWTNLSWLLV